MALLVAVFASFCTLLSFKHLTWFKASCRSCNWRWATNNWFGDRDQKNISHPI